MAVGALNLIDGGLLFSQNLLQPLVQVGELFAEGIVQRGEQANHALLPHGFTSLRRDDGINGRDFIGIIGPVLQADTFRMTQEEDENGF